MKKNFLLIMVLLFSIVNYLDIYAINFTLSYLFAGTAVTYTNYISSTKGMLNAVCTDYFEINPDGTLLLQKVDNSFITNMHNAGIRVTPYLSNNWDKKLGIAALDNSENFTTQLANAIYTNDLDGVDVDIQNVSHEYRDAYTKFVKLLRQKMPDKQISVAVAANPHGWTQGWHGSYDYNALSSNCDYLMIMAYDESYYGSQPGPVASSQFVENSIKYALKHTTPDKLVLGIPFYGRYWKSGSSIGGYGITTKDVENLINNYKYNSYYDYDKQSVKVEITISDADIPPKLWGGKVLTPGEYVIWYDNIQSLAHKLDLAEKYQLLGTGSWALGQENILVWDEYFSRKNKVSDVDELEPPGNIDDDNENLKPTPLLDIYNHWAYKKIASVYNKGWMKGVSYSKFSPDRKLTRAEAATLVLNATQLPDIDENNTSDFDDTKNHWAKKNISKARHYGILSGKGNNLFYPDDYISREEFSVIVDKIFYLTESIDFNNNPFFDVKQESWSYNSIIKLSENNIISGYKDRTFRPKDKISRAETAAIFYGLFGYGINPSINTTDNEKDAQKNELEESQLPR